MIVAEQLSMDYGPEHQVLDRISLRLDDGQFVALVGPSGCGKSTLLRLIAGLETPAAGKLAVDGKPPGDAQNRRRAAFVFQDPNLLPWRTVVDNIRLPLELQRQARSEQQLAVRQSLRLIGLGEADERKYPRMLSGGMRMRVALARALVTRPDILLLDEPFAALDDILRGQLNEDLVGLWQKQAWTTVFVTHNVAEAVFLSQRIVVLSGQPGRVITQLEVPFGYPREATLRSTAEFAALTGQVSTWLRRAVA